MHEGFLNNQKDARRPWRPEESFGRMIDELTFAPDSKWAVAQKTTRKPKRKEFAAQ